MTEPRVLAEFSDYSGMIAAFRARAAERKIAVSSESASHVAGLTDQYLAKLLAPRPVRRIGMLSLAPMLGVLGVKLVMVEDEEALHASPIASASATRNARTAPLCILR